MRKNTLLQPFIYMIILLSFASCQDDDDGGDIIPSFGNREVTIEFQEYTGSPNSFCFVSDEDGLIWWDTIYQNNEGVKIVNVPDNKIINITYGRTIANENDLWLQTYSNVEDYFDGGYQEPKDCGFRSLSYLNTHSLQLTINHVIEPLEILQNGFYSIKDEEYLAEFDEFKCEVRPQQVWRDEGEKLTFIVVRTLGSGETKGALISDSMMLDTNLVLDYNEFRSVDLHIVQLNKSISSRFDFIGQSKESFFLLAKKTPFSIPALPERNYIPIYVPSDIDLQSIELQIEGFQSSNRDIISHYSTNLPDNISLKSTGFENVESSAQKIEYRLEETVDFKSARMAFRSGASWSVNQIGEDPAKFKFPRIPESIQNKIPSMQTSFEQPWLLTVVSYHVDDSNVGLRMDKKNVIDFSCFSFEAFISQIKIE